MKLNIKNLSALLLLTTPLMSYAFDITTTSHYSPRYTGELKMSITRPHIALCTDTNTTQVPGSVKDGEPAVIKYNVRQGCTKELSQPFDVVIKKAGGEDIAKLVINCTQAACTINSSNPPINAKMDYHTTGPNAGSVTITPLTIIK
ncbi:hypothetical protein BH10PSE19_BH10PSE19_17330 [soil metagenome]